MRSERTCRFLRWTPTCVAALLITGGVATAQDTPGGPQWGYLALVPFSILAKSAVQAVIAALFPHWSEKALAAVEERRGLAILWGLLLTVFTFIVFLITATLAGAGGGAGVLAIPGIIFCLAVMLLAIWGFVGPAIWMGERLLPDGSDRRPLQAVLGALVLSLACLLPIVGWGLLVLLFFACLGAGLIATFGRTRSATRGAASEADED